jgi:hypothetical protein
MTHEEQVVEARAERDRAMARYREARERTVADPQRKMLGGLAPSMINAMARRREYHAAVAALRKLTTAVHPCDACKDWHRYGQHSVGLLQRRANLRAKQALKAA